MHDLYVTLHRQLVATGYTAASVLILLAVAAAMPWIGRRLFARVERTLASLARHRALSITLVGIVSLLVGLLLTAVSGPPIPRVHDEFSYLLAGDTFARGRLTNPTHPHWEHFETMHVLFEPTYASKFHPAQGLTLGFGQALFGAPWVGVVVTTALACAALAWALFGWTRPAWALLGGLIASVHPQIVIWSHMYWGGNVGVLAGSLVLGAIPRILRNERVSRNALLLALGGAFLVMSRPYEAMVWAILSGATIASWLTWSRREQIPRLLGRIAVPALAVIVPVLGMVGYYNWRVTGRPTEMPYTLHSRAYMAVPLLFWQELPPPREYRHKELHDQHRVFEWNYFHGQTTPSGWVVGQTVKLYSFIELHLLRNLTMLIGVLALPFAVRSSRWIQLAAAYALGFVIAYASIPWFEHHYVGAAIGLLFVLAMHGWRHVRAWRPKRRRVGQTLAWLCILSCLPVLATVFAREYRNNRGGWWFERHRIEQHLLGQPGEHLVFVRYTPEHVTGHEWVFNSADIDGSRIVWAREMSDQRDRRLIEYFPDRQVWLVHADAYPAVLEGGERGTKPSHARQP
jgi:hypothetical protein